MRLPPTDWVHYTEMAERDRARYDKEKTAYQLKQRESVIGTEDDEEME